VTKFSNPGGVLFIVCLSLVRIALISSTSSAHGVALFIHPVHPEHVRIAVFP
jgi:hypothetical protein